MNVDELIAQGNTYRACGAHEAALACYAQAFVQDRGSAAAFNNYGNVLRELGEPAAGLPFLERAIVLDPNNATAQFNRAVCLLLQGDYARGWPAYESRWNYEHLAGTLPQPGITRWQGQDLQGKTILIMGEQGHGDCIQFSRFLGDLRARGADTHLQVSSVLVPLFQGHESVAAVSAYGDAVAVAAADYWAPIMSLPGLLGVNLDNLPRPVSYLRAQGHLQTAWQQRLGPKTRTRAGVAWSGRRDAWLNQHKSVPLADMLTLITANPQIEWINLQVDATPEESAQLAAVGVRLFPGTVSGFHDTAALIANLDVVITVDTAVAHLSGALGRPTWILLNQFAQCWRWLLARADTPWYSTARLFRQRQAGNWYVPIQEISQFLTWFKV